MLIINNLCVQFFFFLVHKAHKEELENALWILEQVLSLLPELIHKRWQLHSLSRILLKLLHTGNSIRVRRQAIRYFLMWYQGKINFFFKLNLIV